MTNSINELKSYTEYNVNAPTSVFTIGFQYEHNVDHVNVYVNGVEATAAGYTIAHDSHGTISLTPAVPSGVVRVSRETDIDNSAHTFSAGAKFTAGNMDENFQQIRHSQQEVRDDFEYLEYNTLGVVEAAKDATARANNIAAEVEGLLDKEIAHNALHGRDAAEAHPASAILDESGLSQQKINKSNKRLNGNVLDYFTKSELEAWEADQENFDASDAIIRAQNASDCNIVTFPSGTFRITKQIPSTKAWHGVRGSFQTRGTKIIVDNPVTIDPVILCASATGAVDLLGIYFEDKQRLTHTLLKENTYQGVYKGLRIDRFNIGIQTSGTYSYWSDCYFMGNNKGVKTTPTANTGNANSTMFGFTECFFIYNDVGVDVSGVGAGEDLINVPFISCGFELNRIGLNSPNRTWYLTLLNCWFEANTEYGLYAPTSHVLELNTRHNANSPFVVDPKNHSRVLSMVANLQELSIRSLTGDLAFTREYFPNHTGPQTAGVIKQDIGDDAGTASVSIAFKRSAASGAAGGSNIAFSTQATSASGTEQERWIIDRFGRFIPATHNAYAIGDDTHLVSALYTAKVMYSDTVGDFAGSGSPEGVVVANPGSTFRRIDGVTPAFYVKESGVGSTGWVGK